MFFSAAANDERGTHRTIGIARTRDLNGPWRFSTTRLAGIAEAI